MDALKQYFEIWLEPELTGTANKIWLEFPAGTWSVKLHMVLYNTLLNYRDLIGYLRSRDIK